LTSGGAEVLQRGINRHNPSPLYTTVEIMAAPENMAGVAARMTASGTGRYRVRINKSKRIQVLFIDEQIR
jgi:hypothetical protein